jgi:hypothetical protein
MSDTFEVELDKLGTLVASAKNAARYRWILVLEAAGLSAATLEAKPVYDGEGLVLSADLTGGAQAELDLKPKRSDIEKSIAAHGPAPVISTFVVGFPEESGDERAKVVAGPTLKVRKKSKVKVHLKDEGGKPYGQRRYQLKVEGTPPIEGETAADGLVSHELAASATTGELTLFRSREDPKDKITWTVKLGALDPASEVKGVQVRLNNLGFRCAIDGAFSDETRAALRSFQLKRGLAQTSGEIDGATTSALETAAKA